MATLQTSTPTLARPPSARIRKPAILRQPPVIAPSESPEPVLDPATFPDEYCMKLMGSCMEPNLPDGVSVLMRKSEPYKVGDFVTIWWRPELVRPGSHPAWIKRLRMNAAPWVKSYPYDDHPGSELKAIIFVEQLNPRQCFSIPCNNILAIHKAVGYGKAGEIGGKVRSDEIKMFERNSAA